MGAEMPERIKSTQADMPDRALKHIEVHAATEPAAPRPPRPQSRPQSVQSDAPSGAGSSLGFQLQKPRVQRSVSPFCKPAHSPSRELPVNVGLPVAPMPTLGTSIAPPA